jgi:putative PIN family toxin of toxin-antitoxin system
MIVYAVIDTNVLVSAMLSNHPDSATVQVVSRLIKGEITPIYSEKIMHEYKEVLGRKKFKFKSEEVSYILSFFTKYGILVEASETGVMLPDMKDLPFYEVVMEKKDNNGYLVTGNQNLICSIFN